jgi:hypothetical protein
MRMLLGYTLPELPRLQIELEYRLTSDGLLIPREGSVERNRCCLYLSLPDEVADRRRARPAPVPASHGWR